MKTSELLKLVKLHMYTPEEVAKDYYDPVKADGGCAVADRLLKHGLITAGEEYKLSNLFSAHVESFQSPTAVTYPSAYGWNRGLPEALVQNREWRQEIRHRWIGGMISLYAVNGD